MKSLLDYYVISELYGPKLENGFGKLLLTGYSEDIEEKKTT